MRTAGRGARRAAERLGAAITTMICLPILGYQRLVSPALPRRCRYEPTCSRYAVEAVRLHGPGRGLVLAAWRLLRCNPFSPGGFDPVTAQRLFRRAARRRDADPAGAS